MTAKDTKKKSASAKHATPPDKKPTDDTAPANDRSESRAPHFDQKPNPPVTNTEVEIAKGSDSDSFQTDSRPR